MAEIELPREIPIETKKDLVLEQPIEEANEEEDES